MEKLTRRFSIFILAIFLLSFMQFLRISIFGVVPNIVLATLVISIVFLNDTWHRMFLVSFASFMLKFSASADRDILAFFAVGLLMIVVDRYLPWQPLMNGIFLATIATVLFYLFTVASSIISLMFVLEMGYTIALVCLLYYLLTRFSLFRTGH